MNPTFTITQQFSRKKLLEARFELWNKRRRYYYRATFIMMGILIVVILMLFIIIWTFSKDHNLLYIILPAQMGLGLIYYILGFIYLKLLHLYHSRRYVQLNDHKINTFQFSTKGILINQEIEIHWEEIDLNYLKSEGHWIHLGSKKHLIDIPKQSFSFEQLRFIENQIKAHGRN